MDIYYFGPEGTFTQQAAMDFVNVCGWPQAQLRPVSSIADALLTVQQAMAQAHPAFACIPLENSIQGSVTASWDGLGHKASSALPHPSIVSALKLSIHQNLMVKDSSVSLSELKTVYSHPQALAQCRDWISQNLPQAVAVSAESTAAAARRVAESQDKSVAAIGAAAAAKLYQLYLAKESIEDIANNTTRFGLVGDAALFESAAGGFVVSCKNHSNGKPKETLSLLLSQVENSPGGLSKVLKPFSDSHFNLNRIESRPVGTHLGTYVFYIDVEYDSVNGKQYWSQVEDVLYDLGVEVKVLGHFCEF
ncbi:prephenate dehydratase [Alicyclobacillus sp. SO9]|uniref:prephenate dehydratase n=1 Tax=Alicyclobacillus sp. SO9 TaxID=2665646 RepID=UPI0018E77958|nr:prephenate dehydratase [Alicyclobacillus sp. SO9]QQE80835.1 prephenate dehydratase [Alicyclobacillus sp. SO9]